MTGYGKVVLELNAKTVRIEIKSLNSKSLDLNVRMPNDYRPKELELRKIIGSRLKRGKIDVSFYVDIEKATEYAAEDAEITFKLYLLLKNKLIEGKNTSAYNYLEKSLVPSILEMEAVFARIVRWDTCATIRV